MGQQSKRTRAPAPLKVPSSASHLVPPAAPHLVPPAAPQLFFPPVPQSVPPLPHPNMPVVFPPVPGGWIPPRPPQQSVPGSLAQGPCWAPPAGIGGSESSWCMPENIDDSDPQAWGLDSHPPGGFLGFFKNTPSHTEVMGNGTSSQPITVGDDTSGGNCKRTEKRLPWTKEEDLRLVSAWLNNSNDPIQSNYKKNEQYWKEVTAVYNSTTPKNRERLLKQEYAVMWSSDMKVLDANA
ncbi:proline-rich receptor-like protein kinase PERK1 isoform X2 [Lolium rigidum]|uniref:proline-rich receptor-like protein kinase PERK1 isoform X2 n=1 Tax=Lolium rigidum TaxID=89674 RepID=UPI001F5DCAF1|nr:proline-rich receptor-like protein kinase PERK1 isoform X2 [Lolium rigidum]